MNITHPVALILISIAVAGLAFSRPARCAIVLPPAICLPFALAHRIRFRQAAGRML